MITYRTFEEFWGWFLLVRYHRDNHQRWESMRERAGWIVSHLGGSTGTHLVDLGCGNGLLDIALAGQGLRMTGIDRLSAVLENARREAEERSVDGVTFVTADIRKIDYPPNSFDGALMFEVMGLLGKRDESSLLAKTYGWLAQGGSLFVDIPKEPRVESARREEEFDEGTFELTTTYDRVTRVLEMEPVFRAKSGEEIHLVDPYDESSEKHQGVIRYLYPPDELAFMLNRIGFRTEIVRHYDPDRYYLIKATRTTEGEEGNPPEQPL